MEHCGHHSVCRFGYPDYHVFYCDGVSMKTVEERRKTCPMCRNKNKIKAWLGNGGALMVSEEIEGVTQALGRDPAAFYGGKFFVCESITPMAAKVIAEAMGWEFIDDPG